jgi:release factor glutamine methyltransferase
MAGSELGDEAGWVPDTLGRAHAALAQRFRAAGLDTPEIDARRLVSAAASVSAERLITSPEMPLDDVTRRRVAAHGARRLAREPVSRILGRRDFYGRAIDITPATLDPRPETETLVDVVLDLVREDFKSRSQLRICDIGTGSGVLLITLLAELPGASGLGTDLAPAALAVARRNAERHGVADRATWQVARSLEGIVGPFDVLVCNPPYIPSDIIATLDPEVRQFDPRLALDGGTDGLDVYRQLLASAGPIVPAGIIAFEVGAGQARVVAELGRATLALRNTRSPIICRDLGGIERCVVFLTL